MIFVCSFVAEDDGHLKSDHVAAALVALISQGQKKCLRLRLNLVALVGLQQDNEQLISSELGKNLFEEHFQQGAASLHALVPACWWG